MEVQTVQVHQGAVWSMTTYQLHYDFAIAQGASDSEASRVAEESILESNEEGK